MERRPEDITKLDAARRQLRTAVVLFFDHGDEVSIHTLAAAAYQILIDLVHHEGKTTRLEKSTERVIKPEFLSLARKTLRRAQNFFKHADEDPTELLDFDAREPQFLLFACADAYNTLTGRHLRELWAFIWWFMWEFPDFLKPGPFKIALLAAIGDRPHAHRDRRLFWTVFNRTQLPDLD
jgi:hypothetical protein